MEDFISLIRERRPSGTNAARSFGRRVLEPVFGRADGHGNYFLTVGAVRPPILFAAHYDTVHAEGGTQKVVVADGMVSLPARTDSNCLGADCTAGLWIILRMVAAGVPGAYAVFADEEIGGVGSNGFLRHSMHRLEGIRAVLSFDRKGTSEIITHQMGERTASDAFAESLSAVLGMEHRPSSFGTFTDSAVFASEIQECANLAVGYDHQHTSSETQDLHYLADLCDRLISADWSALVYSRDPTVYEPASAFRPYCDITDDYETRRGRIWMKTACVRTGGDCFPISTLQKES